MKAGEIYVNIRQFLGTFIGRTVIDITQHDSEEFRETGQAYVMLMFDDGSWLKFPIKETGLYSSSQ